MPVITVECTACTTVSEVFRHHTDWPKTPACPKCDGTTQQIHLPSGMDIHSDPVVVFKAPDGSFRFPGDPNGISAQAYQKKGFERVEIRGWADVRRFEREVNTREAKAIQERVERHLECRNAGVKMRRSEVYAGMMNGFQIPETKEVVIDGRPQIVRTGRMKTVRMSEYGKDIMRQMCARNDRKAGPREYDPGFHVQAFSENRSNREESRGADGKKYRD